MLKLICKTGLHFPLEGNYLKTLRHQGTVFSKPGLFLLIKERWMQEEARRAVSHSLYGFICPRTMEIQGRKKKKDKKGWLASLLGLLGNIWTWSLTQKQGFHNQTVFSHLKQVSGSPLSQSVPGATKISTHIFQNIPSLGRVWTRSV